MSRKYLFLYLHENLGLESNHHNCSSSDNCNICFGFFGDIRKMSIIFGIKDLELCSLLAMIKNISSILWILVRIQAGIRMLTVHLISGKIFCNIFC